MVNYLENDDNTQQARIPVSAAPITIFGEQVIDEDSINSKPVEEVMKLTKEETSSKNDDLLHTLKMRLVKGEINKEEYLELKKLIE